MPKAKTNSKKFSQSKNGLLSKFSKLSNSKRRGILFILVFALFGAAALIRSYALTPHLILYNDQNGYIFTMNPDGTSKKRLDPSTDHQIDAQSSPSGSRVAYGRYLTGIYVANIDGSNIRELVKTPKGGYYDSDPKWSSSGAQIMYVRTLPNTSPNRYQLRVVNSDGTNDHWIASYKVVGYADWVNGTSQIVVSDFSQQNIYTINSDGTGRKVIISKIPYLEKVISVGNTKKVVFYGNGPQGGDLYSLNLDGSGLKYLGWNSYPKLPTKVAKTYSETGSQHGWYGSSFLFISTKHKSDGTAYWALVKSNVDGSGKTVIATSAKQILNAVWSNDGKGVVFDTIPSPANQMTINSSVNYVNADGSGLKVLASSKFESPGIGSYTLLNSW